MSTWGNTGLFSHSFAISSQSINKYGSKFQFHKLKKYSCCEWDLNLGQRDSKLRSIQWAILASAKVASILYYIT